MEVLTPDPASALWGYNAGLYETLPLINSLAGHKSRLRQRPRLLSKTYVAAVAPVFWAPHNREPGVVLGKWCTVTVTVPEEIHLTKLVFKRGLHLFPQVSSLRPMLTFKFHLSLE